MIATRKNSALWPEHDFSSPLGCSQGKAKAAFSLIEVMVAILILGIALVGLTQGITTALTSSKESELQTTAALFAAGRIEELRAEGELTDGTDDGDCGDDLENYQWHQAITSTEVDGLHDVQIVIEQTRSGRPIYELRTLLFEAPDVPATNAPSSRRELEQPRATRP